MATPDVVRIGAVGIGPAGRDPTPLLAAAEAGIRRAAAAGADLVVLPELFAWPYAAAEDPRAFPEAAEAPDGTTGGWAGALADELGVALLWGTAIRRGAGRPVNAAVLARPGAPPTVVARKIHLPSTPAAGRFGEADRFEPGPPEIATFAVGTIRMAALVCYDRRFPECWRAAAAAGADVVAVLVAGPAPDDPPGFFAAELATHARANAVYAVAAARHGVETVTGRPVRHDGETMALGPDGDVLAGPCPPDAPTLVVAVDFARLAAARAANPTAERLRLGRTAAFKGETPWQN